jgi:hypothetical protein
MGYFPTHMYDSQINMITKPFELNKERLRKDFMSPKYENRRKEFFATFSEFLRTHIREKYYNFMNDIQTEINFFEWFEKYCKPKILADRNTNSLLQNKTTHRPLTTPNTIITKDKTTNHAYRISNTPSLTPLTKTHTHEIPNTSHTRLLTPNHAIADNIHFAKKQTLLASQYGQINTIKKDNTYKDRKKHKLDKIVNPPPEISREKVIKHKPICYKYKKTDHYQNNCVSNKKPSKSNSKLKTPDLHSEINSLKQEIKEIKTSSFQITEEQLAQEMIALKINNNHPQYPIIEKEIEPQENCKQIVQLITQPNFKEIFINLDESKEVVLR